MAWCSSSPCHKAAEVGAVEARKCQLATAQARKEAEEAWQKLREAELGISGDPAERLRLQRERMKGEDEAKAAQIADARRAYAEFLRLEANL